MFKEPLAPLRQSVTLRERVEEALSGFKAECGVAESSNIKQCVRSLATRVHMAGGGGGGGEGGGGADSRCSLQLDVRNNVSRNGSYILVLSMSY